MYRRRRAGDQLRDIAVEFLVFEYIEKSAASVLAATAIGARERTLLIHIAEDGIGIGAGGGYADLGMVEVRAQAAGEAECLALPMSGGGDFNRARFAKRWVPAADGRGFGGRLDFRVGPPGGSPQGNSTKNGGDHLPWRNMQVRGFRDQHDTACERGGDIGTTGGLSA